MDESHSQIRCKRIKYTACVGVYWNEIFLFFHFFTEYQSLYCINMIISVEATLAI